MSHRLPAWIGGSVIAIAFAVVGFAFVKHFSKPYGPPIPQGGKAEPDEPDAMPFTLADLEKLEANLLLSREDLSRLVACFKLADEDARLQAVLLLARHPESAIGKVRNRLRHHDARVRFCAVETLGFMGPAAAVAVNDLVDRLSDDDANVRYKAVFALGRIGVRNEQVYAGLIGALADTDESVSETVLEVFESIDTLPEASAPALVSLLIKNANPEKRSKLLPILAKTGDPAVPVFRRLLKTINPKNSDPATYPDYLNLIQAADKLSSAQLRTMLPELNVLLYKVNHGSQAVEAELLNLFKKCGSDGARSMAESLKSVRLEGVVHSNRLELLKAIGSLGPHANVATPLLIDVLKANTPKCAPVEYRPQILETLGDIGPSASDAIPAIEALLMEPELAAEARGTLRRLGVIEKKK